ncbi:hypothetical protein TTHERM_000688475 (macronuclear) [Tetrahymena thermophila SB210]|uniref:Uncharacterized protein n=1 Tax=Tetrahymena thermophila (strain SB210) TaxID=312017 RepID=W7X007_TETTS|nr:hypothetical protein TTHERM_000688475 [Tetrahymena thermophila SB210]EWS71202.1 hypothetical protein TTHERM_000688475 [Tetrahymena thermophila SB210]|eukprot:XP_012656255.1 hypothetical protein TTHERM_000688475 [Tetrahymena thermophila SB210]
MRNEPQILAHYLINSPIQSEILMDSSNNENNAKIINFTSTNYNAEANTKTLDFRVHIIFLHKNTIKQYQLEFIKQWPKYFELSKQAKCSFTVISYRGFQSTYTKFEYQYLKFIDLYRDIAQHKLMESCYYILLLLLRKQQILVQN